MTKEECAAVGGHCWQSTGMASASIPPRYHEYCKHCPQTRVAIPQDMYRYEYPDTTV